jgi:hypothetical protein
VFTHGGPPTKEATDDGAKTIILPEIINSNDLSIIDNIIYYKGCEPYIVLEQIGLLRICSNERQVALKQNAVIVHFKEALSKKLDCEVGFYTSRHTYFVYPFVQLTNREILCRNYDTNQDQLLPLAFFEKNTKCLHCKYILKVNKLRKREDVYHVGFTLTEIHFQIKQNPHTKILFGKMF